MDVSSMAAPEALSAHDVLETNENENLVEEAGEEALDQDEYELTELKNVGAECKIEPKEKEEDGRQDSPLEELTEDDDSTHASNGGGGSEEGRFLVNRGGRITLGQAQPTSQQQNQMAAQRDSLYLDQIQTVAQDVMISGYQTQRNPTTSHSTHRVVTQSTTSSANGGGTPQVVGATHGEGRPSVPSGSSGYYLLKTPSGGSGHVPIRIVHGPESHSSPGGARVTVVPATRSHNGTAVLQLPPGQMVRSHQRVQIIHTPSSGGQNNSHFNDHHRVSVGDPGVTVTERGSVGGGMHVVKKDQSNGGVSTMLVDSGSYYHNGSGQKVYRIINVQDDSAGLSGPPRKRMAIVPPRSQAQSQQEYKVNMVSMAPSTSRVQQLSQLNDEVIIDDGIQDRTVVIDPDVNPPESPMLADSPGIGSMMISGHQSSLGPPSPGSHPGYLQQSQYDADLQFQQLISSSLSRLDENEKAIMKFHIQRILLEARYGAGISQRLLLQEDELESVSNGVSHELVSQ